MKNNPIHTAILQILDMASAHKLDMSSREIFNELEPAEQGFFKNGVSGLCMAIDYLSRKGFVEKGGSEIVDKKTVLTWRITKSGKDSLKDGADDKSPWRDLPEGTIVLDPANEVDAPFIEIVKMFRAASAIEPAEPITISGKDEIIGFLKKVSKVPFLTGTEMETLAKTINFINQFEEAANV